MRFGMTDHQRVAAQILRSIVPAFLIVVTVVIPLSAPSAEPGARSSGADRCLLRLPVPAADQIQFELQSSVRGPGMRISWPDIEVSETTCAVMIEEPIIIDEDTLGLGFPVALTGDYADTFDRLLDFSFFVEGTVGDPERNAFFCDWKNLNNALSGRIEGRINLSNTGGLWIHDASVARFYQHNIGLPVQSVYTNLVDVAASPDGRTVVAGITTGLSHDTNPLGLFRSITQGGVRDRWRPVSSGLFGTNRTISRVAMSPTDPAHAHFAVGTRADGVFVTTNGGLSFAQYSHNLDSDFSPSPTRYHVTALVWTDDRLYVAIEDFGLFYAVPPYNGFQRLTSFIVGADDEIPRVHSLAVDPSDVDRLVIGLTLSTANAVHNGVYEYMIIPSGVDELRSLNDGEFVGHLDGGVSNPAARKTVTSLYIDPDDGQRMIMGTNNQGIWHTINGGIDWHEASTPMIHGDGITQEDRQTQPPVSSVVLHGGWLLAQVVGRGVHEWSGADVWSGPGDSWNYLEDQPFNTLGRRIVSTEAGLMLATTGGGIYTPNTAFTLTSTITTIPRLDLGLSLAFGEGQAILAHDPDYPDDPDRRLPRHFQILAQNYQGWIVWRADGGTPEHMQMIGRYDKLNPETCIQGFCGDDNYVIDPLCFGETLAACFDFSEPGRISFYDDNVFNGFTYHYAVTPYDYGDISMLQSPTALTNPMVFPPRFPDDPLVLPRFDDDPLPEGMGNRRRIQIDTEAAPHVEGEGIYVFPNPLRLGSGMPGGEGREVVWTNLPRGSKIQVFTVAGDHIADLPQPDQPQQGGNIYWTTVNASGQPLAAGLYMWKVTMPYRKSTWGKLVIIR